MIKTDILSSVFDNYDIHKVILLPTSNYYNFIISDMPSSISIDRWEYLENILKELTKKEINIFTYNQAIKYFGKNIITKGQVIKQ